MTPARQPQEKRCPDFDLHKLEEDVRMWKEAGYVSFHEPISCDVLLDIIEGCATHTSDPAPCPYNASDDMCLECKAHEQKIAETAAKAAREQDIKILEDYRNSLDYPDCPPGDTIKRLIQSLRQPEPQQEGRR
jgi:hypothetical protein